MDIVNKMVGFDSIWKKKYSKAWDARDKELPVNTCTKNKTDNNKFTVHFDINNLLQHLNL